MNWYNILQSIITWLLTSFALSCILWASRTSKRLTVLEEHDKEELESLEAQQTVLRMQEHHITVLEEHDKVQSESLTKLDNILKNQEQISTKMDLLLAGKLKLQRGNGDED